MRKIVISLILISLLALPAVSLAQLTATTPPATAPEIGFLDALKRITDWMFVLLMIVAALFVIISAFSFVTAAGDPEKIKTARNYLLYALVGALVGLLAKGLVKFVEVMVVKP